MPRSGIWVTEIFRSLQGEGRWQGSPCTFIRTAGCNLSCRWCDTPHSRSGGTLMAGDDILSAIESLGEDYICITGGEPLLQGEELLVLVASLATRGCAVDIETNGTLDFTLFQDYASICMDVKCPSSGEESDLDLLSCLSHRDSVKFVVDGEEDCQYAATVLDEYTPACPVFFSPVWGTDAAAVAGFILDQHLPVRLQVQLHKILGVP